MCIVSARKVLHFSATFVCEVQHFLHDNKNNRFVSLLSGKKYLREKVHSYWLSGRYLSDKVYFTQSAIF
jgi:hypothetical protein